MKNKTLIAGALSAAISMAPNLEAKTESSEVLKIVQAKEDVCRDTQKALLIAECNLSLPGENIQDNIENYTQLQEEYLSYFLKDKVIQKFTEKFGTLSLENQQNLLDVFESSTQYIGSRTDKEKQQYAGRLFKIFEEIDSKSGKAGDRLELLIGKYPELKGNYFEDKLTLLSTQADFREGFQMSPEQEARMRELELSIAQSEQNIAQSEQNIAQLDKLIAAGKQMNSILANNKDED